MNQQENEPMNPHDSWADHYDCVYKLTQGDDYQRVTDLTLREIGRLASPPARIVDFGAGTGRLTIPLAQMGYHVTAIDASAEMCRVLRAKAAAGVEGAVAAPCVVCQQNSVPADQRRPVEVALCHQSIIEPLPDNGFDLGLCVFTVLNYIVEEASLRSFASVGARAIRPGGKLLVSFVANMAPKIGHFNGASKSGKSPDGRCSAVRNININPRQETLYEYTETSELTKDGKRISYRANIRLREWSREQIVAAIEAAGFCQERKFTDRFPVLGEVYLLFRRKRPDPWRRKNIKPGYEPRPKTTLLLGGEET